MTRAALAPALFVLACTCGGNSTAIGPESRPDAAGKVTPLRCPPREAENGPECPTSIPAEGSACSRHGLYCAAWGACNVGCACSNGAWRCAARSCTPGCNYDDPAVCYYGRSPKGCESLDFECPKGSKHFEDACGCGCR